MPPNGRIRCQSLTPDILTDLPNNVIDIILMRLPCEEAVRTSILAKRWRYHWCRLTKLTLDWSLWRTENDLLNPTYKFTEIISQILTLHEGPLTDFTLDVDNLESCRDIGSFINIVLRNNVQILVLHLPEDSKLPTSVFTCSQLRYLSLHNCSIHHPSAFEGFDKLISLELCEVTISSELLESIISHCPLLEQLMLDIPKLLNTIEIDAPMLSSFDFTGNISSICLKNVPLLVEVSLAGYQIMEKDIDFAKVFNSYSAIEYLSLNIACVWFFADEAPKRLPFYLNRVKHLHLSHVELKESYTRSCALCLIQSFPHLEYLKIELIVVFKNPLELERFSDVTFNHLREVEIISFRGTTPEMQLIKILLAKSPVLVKMYIDPAILIDTGSEILAELVNFQRASPEAEIDIKYYGKLELNRVETNVDRVV
ncbi:hypothetical protein R3W88_028563 [Solanum pinnatisectum]|uniref:F-box domain-containing protein n=1 Tax=Solanum pinnatisectum TaxID=50273 RepID=A0AAV9K3Y3_9SOLN|nr:hypothetical protein R3W88_028563 [Solanum pinnatisectum]